MGKFKVEPPPINYDSDLSPKTFHTRSVVLDTARVGVRLMRYSGGDFDEVSHSSSRPSTNSGVISVDKVTMTDENLLKKS